MIKQICGFEITDINRSNFLQMKREAIAYKATKNDKDYYLYLFFLRRDGGFDDHHNLKTHNIPENCFKADILHVGRVQPLGGNDINYRSYNLYRYFVAGIELQEDELTVIKEAEYETNEKVVAYINMDDFFDKIKAGLGFAAHLSRK